MTAIKKIDAWIQKVSDLIDAWIDRNEVVEEVDIETAVATVYCRYQNENDIQAGTITREGFVFETGIAGQAVVKGSERLEKYLQEPKNMIRLDNGMWIGASHVVIATVEVKTNKKTIRYHR